MRRLTIDKSSILLILIIAIALALVVGLGLGLKTDASDLALKNDRILNLLIVFEVDKRPTATELFLFYPATGKGALLDVPVETGLIIKSLNRVDKIDALYDARRPNAYVDEIARLLDAEVPNYLILDASDLAAATDLLEGLEVFVPEAIAEPGPPPVRLPSGALILDGDKVLQYASYRNPDETEADRAGRRQKLIQSFVKRVGERSAWLSRPEAFLAFKRCLRTNLSDEALRHLVAQLGGLDADRLLLQRITGTYKSVDGKLLLFPHYDGELVRDIVKQTLNALANSGGSGVVDKIYTVEILNGTPQKGVAKKTAEIFQSFGFDVISVGNADRDDYDKTIVLDRLSNPEAAKSVAAVIRCNSISGQGGQGTASTADFTVILGDDFNGRYCAK
jgi:anionic cell wall polymer biosynthesis LytR-Cps2A-Psr (LCP) family protein